MSMRVATRHSVAFLLGAAVAILAVPTPSPRAAAEDPVLGISDPGGGTPEAVSPSWWDETRSSIENSEYEITWQAGLDVAGLDEAWHAPNRAHGFRIFFLPSGIRVVPRTESDPTWEWGLSLIGIGRDGFLGRAVVGRLTPEGNRITHDRGAFAEWFVNSPEGLEHGFDLAAAPAGRDRDGSVGGTLPVEITLAVTGTLVPVVADDGQAVDFVTGGGVRVVRYARLKAFDAAGRELPSRMEGLAWEGRSAIRLVIDDADALYPVTVDPLATSPSWTAETTQASGAFGFSVATAGDVNGDGYSDVIVGAYLYDNGETDEGRAFVYHGSPSGPGTSPAWTAESNQGSSAFGISVATAGDVNGDGYSDVIVGAYLYDNGETDEGRAFVYHGSASGLATSANWTAEPDQAGARFAFSVATAGDVNGDGYSDVIVGAPYLDNGQTDEGRAFVCHGSASGLAASAAWTAEADVANSLFGIAAGTAGDVNGDGYSDVIVGASGFANGQSGEGRASVYHGSGSGLAASPAWSQESNVANANFGRSAATAGDVNGDGYSDVIVGAPAFANGQSGEGRASVYHGSAGGLATTAAWVVESNQANASYGWSAATAGDTNGDGFADVLVGAYQYDNGETDEGRALAYLGSPSGLASSPAWTAEGNQASGRFGRSVATAGDVNGDGISDVIIGADNYLTRGRAFVYVGTPAGLGTGSAWASEANQAAAAFGASVASAGDVNGDGYGDVIVGAPSYDNGQTDEGRAFAYYGSAAGLATSASWTAEGNQTGASYGRSVASAGDVNGDGYGDVIVGVPAYDNGQTDEGRALTYHGSAAGLAASAIWSAEGNQAGAAFGRCVASAGNVNGDAYGDVIVGSPGYDNGQTDEGRVSVFHGSSAGLPASPAWTAESNQASADFGISAASAGDVNADGYSDVVVGADLYDNGQTDEGRAYAYLGSKSGLLISPVWLAEPDQAGARFGFSVGSAGDVDGDSFADVLVGAYLYDNVEADEGRAFLFRGSVNGLSAASAWTAEPDQAGAAFGYVVAPAGDVNGDGYADVLVGAYLYDNVEMDEGRVSVFHGSASGLPAAATWTAEGNQAGAWFGYSAASAGDVNGDGYADVVVGASSWDNVEADEGAAFLHLGNAGPAMSVKPQQRRADNAAPVAPLGASESTAAFRLTLVGRSPFGRGRVRLEWEVKLAGDLLDGTGLQQSAAWTDSGTAGATLNSQVTGLAEGGFYHWRARTLYRLAATPFQGHGPWISVPWNSPQEVDLRTRCGSSPPVGSPVVTMSKAGESATVSWTTIAGATVYDLVRGGLGTLRATAGDFSQATDACLADNTAGTSQPDATVPVAEDGFWYLVRGGAGTAACAAGSYNEGNAYQVGGRDGEVAFSPFACP